MPLIALLVLACSGPPAERLTWRESWEVLAVTDGGGFVDASLTVGNTGLLQGQGHLRVDRATPTRPPLHIAIDVPAVRVEIDDGRETVRMAASGLVLGPDGQRTLTTRSADGSGTLVIVPLPSATATPAAWTAGGGQWRVDAPVTLATLAGGLASNLLGGELSGIAVVLHRGGDAIPRGPRRTALALGPDTSIAVDEQGEGRLAWAVVDGVEVDATHARIEVVGPKRWRVDLRPGADVVVDLRRPEPVVVRAPLHHLLAPERWLATAAGLPKVRTVRRMRADLSMAGVSRPVMGLAVEAR